MDNKKNKQWNVVPYKNAGLISRPKLTNDERKGLETAKLLVNKIMQKQAEQFHNNMAVLSNDDIYMTSKGSLQLIITIQTIWRYQTNLNEIDNPELIHIDSIENQTRDPQCQESRATLTSILSLGHETHETIFPNLHSFQEFFVSLSSNQAVVY